MSLTVAVVDDDDDYRLVVRLALERGPDVSLVGEASEASRLPEIARRSRPDLLLLDPRMPGAPAAASEGRAQMPGLRVIMTTSLPARHVGPLREACGAAGSLARDVPVARLGAALTDLAAIVTAGERALRTARQTLPGDLRSVRQSRRIVGAALRGWCEDDVVAAAELAISELATNGIQHGGGGIEVSVAVGATSARVEVSDRNPAPPLLRQAANTDEGGRGLQVISQLATRWGVTERRTGKSVWFELDRSNRSDRIPVQDRR